MSEIDRSNSADTELVFAGPDGEPFTTSLVISAETGNQHQNVVELVRDNLSDLSEVGIVRFETAKLTEGRGRPTTYAELDEPAAALLMTYLRNSPVVKDFKKRLVAGFYAMRQQLTQRQLPAGEELLALAVLEAQSMIAKKDDQIAGLERQREADRPAVEYFDTHVVVTDDVMLIKDWGRTYGLTEPQAFALLRDEKKLIYPMEFERWSRKRGRKVTEVEYRPRAGKPSFTWFDVKEQRDAPRRNNGQARKTMYIKAIHAVDLARLVGLLPSVEAVKSA